MEEERKQAIRLVGAIIQCAINDSKLGVVIQRGKNIKPYDRNETYRNKANEWLYEKGHIEKLLTHWKLDPVSAHYIRTRAKKSDGIKNRENCKLI